MATFTEKQMRLKIKQFISGNFKNTEEDSCNKELWGWFAFNITLIILAIWGYLT